MARSLKIAKEFGSCYSGSSRYYQIWMKKMGMILILLLFEIGGTEISALDANGYIKHVTRTTIPESRKWIFDNMLHNRLNISWYPSKYITVSAGVRNRFFYGDMVTIVPEFAEQMTNSDNYLKMTWNLASGSSYVFNTTVDRLYLDFSYGSWQIRCGKQRINWGRTAIWNPNDIFNSFDFFDFDYEERPGADAVLLRYYTGTFSSVELVSSISESFDSVTAAGMYQFNRWGYDIQLFTGKMNTDIVIGVGWAGEISSAGFNGEISGFIPYIDSGSETIVATVGSDYRFPNTLGLQGELIYHSNPAERESSPEVYSLTVRNLISNKWSFYGGFSIEITPLLSVALNGIWNIDDQSGYAGGNFLLSLNDNTTLQIAGQYFDGAKGSQYSESNLILYSNMKWNF